MGPLYMGNTVRTVPCIGLASVDGVDARAALVVAKVHQVKGGVGLGVPGRVALSRSQTNIKPV